MEGDSAAVPGGNPAQGEDGTAEGGEEEKEEEDGGNVETEGNEEQEDRPVGGEQDLGTTFVISQLEDSTVAPSMKKKLVVFRYGSGSDLSDDYTIDYEYPQYFRTYRAEGQSYRERPCGRVMDCGTCFSKYILCFFNFIILVAGAGVLFLGVWMYADKDSLMNVASAIDENALPQLEFFTEPEMSANISYILMAVGGSMFILSILGYCGALRESRCLLGFYGFLLVLILILEITAAGLAFVYKDTAEDEVRSLLKDTITSYYTPDYGKENAQTQFLNLVMTKMDCCGIDNYKDFYMSPHFNQSGYVVPPACCIFKDINGNKTLLDPDCPKSPKPQNSYYMMGCYETIMQQIKEHMDIVIYVVVGLIVVELLSTFLAFCLCKSLEQYDK